MSVQVYADNTLVYDSSQPNTTPTSLNVVTQLKAGGSASITLPPNHPCVEWNEFIEIFVPYATIIRIERTAGNSPKETIFYGRALYYEEDVHLQKTVICESERCFLNDTLLRPAVYTGTLRQLFTAIITIHNEQADIFKQFGIGTVDVSTMEPAPNFAVDNAMTTAAAVDQLIESYGGYITFTDINGIRTINWVSSVGDTAEQPIEFGVNLLAFARATNTGLATRLLPYGGAVDGVKVTIESVNGGVDYIDDLPSQAVYGVITATQTWNDITDAATLLLRATEWLASAKRLVTSIDLSVIDLATIDANIATYACGDTVHIISRPHSVDVYYQVMERRYDLIDPSKDKLTLGATSHALTKNLQR